MTALDFSADIGLLAVFLGTTNICLGQLIAVRYSPWRLWPHRRINIFVVHNWTAYLLITSVLIHPLILLFSTNSRWRLLDVALPVRSPVQPSENTIGAVSVYLIGVVLSYSPHVFGFGSAVTSGSCFTTSFMWRLFVSSFTVFLRTPI